MSSRKKETTGRRRQKILSILWRDAIVQGDHDLTTATGLELALQETQKALDDAITQTCETFERLMDREVDPTKARDRAIKMLSDEHTPEVATLLVEYVIEESMNFSETPEA